MLLMCCHSNKGVQVELGIPYELWDKPSAEVSKMHRAVSQLFHNVVELYNY